MMQTLIKLERWSDALDFCDRALHIDGTCVKALSRRASTFVQLAAQAQCLTASLGATPAAAAAVTATEITATATSVSSPGSIGVAVGEVKLDNASGVSTEMCSTTSGKTKGVVGVTGGGGEHNGDDGGGEGGLQALYNRFGGREGLLALALADLDRAVETDPESEDVRRQRDALRTEINEEKVIGHI